MKLSVRESSLPICIVHGTEDQSVKFDSSVSFVDMLQKASVPHTFLPLEGAPHTPMAHVERIDEEMTRFLSNCAEQWGD
jgi:dipeptidyl aminopeptidase/acylaminoacyl peptidase